MHYKSYPVQIWFLSDNLQQSAEWLSNKQLVKTINGCMNILNSARFYFIGIRSFTFYKYYFDKERKDETLNRFFPLWPLKQKPLFNQYKSKTSKWCRMCKEHYDYVKSYLDILLDEYEFRYQKEHGLKKFSEWLDVDAPQLQIPEGHISKIVVPWKILNPKFRCKDICEGYRRQYAAMLQNDGVKIDDFKNRDIPEFLLSKDSKWME